MRIIFDLDGTLVDTAPDIRACANATLADEGFGPITRDQAVAFIGNGARAFVTRLELAAAGSSEPQRLERMHARFLARYETAHALTRPFPGVEAALQALRTTGWSIGLCTNKPIAPARALLTHLGWDGRFDHVWGAGMLPVMKPDPAPLHAVIDALGGGPAIYVGDSEVDAATAQAANVPFALFTRGYRKSEPEAIAHHHAFDDYATLPDAARALLQVPG
ncbi:MAG: phosphoglycolate phosphatase, bacterial [Rhodobacteraceae bacterium HLUCCA12]|nr:MAG: phosphoglycolate phosphatase, bacterial [Rhodobacteraceae bacterium HLUCCA12]